MKNRPTRNVQEVGLQTFYLDNPHEQQHPNQKKQLKLFENQELAGIKIDGSMMELVRPPT